MRNKVEVFQVNFKDEHNKDISPEKQAITILDKVKKLHEENGYGKIGITYSANQGQTETIQDIYAKGNWKTSIWGANQASVMTAVENLLKDEGHYKNLQNVFRIVPITTMSASGGPAKDQDVTESLNSASKFIDEGGYLLGWTNQTTLKGTLAIGGGIAAKIQTEPQKDMISEWANNVFFSKTDNTNLYAHKASQYKKHDSFQYTGQSSGYTTREHVESNQPKYNSPNNKKNNSRPINMTILSGFIASIGVAAVAIAFTVLNNAARRITAGLGIAALLSGAGLFTVESRKKDKKPPISKDKNSKDLEENLREKFSIK